MSVDRESIVAVGTAAGAGSRAMIRVSGGGVLLGLAPGILGPAHDLLAGERRGVGIGRLSVDPDLELPIIVTTAPGPNSFTGEDVVEIQVPAPGWLAGRIRDALVRRLGDAGTPARPAGPGEFSARAFLAGRLSATDAMGIALAIEAEHGDELEIADRVRGGDAGSRWGGIRARLVSLVARLEAGIDFTDEEDVVACSSGECRTSCLRIAEDLDRTRSSLAVARGVVDGDPKVVLVGPANAGKSTLFNALAGSNRSVVADHPGTTRDAIEATVRIGGSGRTITLVDVAGFGDSADPLAKEAAAAGRRAVEDATVVLDCRPVDAVDDRAGPATSPTRENGRGIPVVLEIHTKSDLAPASEVVESAGDLRVSARTGTGLASLKEAIARALDAVAGPTLSVLQRDLLGRVARACEIATTQVRAAGDLAEIEDRGAAVPMPEVVAATLRLAIDALAELDGELDPELVLDEVFGRFCIGK